LSDELARAGLNKTLLARKAHLGRTTVSEAFRSDGPIPSAATVVALARALNLQEEDLLKLQRVAAGEEATSDVEDDAGPGKSIGQWEPHALEVHPAGPTLDRPGSGSPEQRVLPGYVRREHDRVLATAVQDAQEGRSRMVVLVGNSSTGKTRACWEAVQPLAGEGWRLWHPFDPTRAEAALEDLERVRPRTVVWLNEAQHYLGDDQIGERVAAAVHSLLTHSQRTPVLILATLWPEYARAYTALPRPGDPDSHSRVRELLAGRTLSVPDRFDAPALRAASALAKDGDRLLANTLTRASTHGQVTQDLAGVPELLQRYEYGTPTGRAVLEVAMDARRLGVGLHLPQAFLTDAAIDYLSDTDYDNLPDDWAEAAFAELAHLVHGKQAPLRRAAARPARRPPKTPPPTTSPGSAAGPSFRLADYLEQHGRTARRHLCPPSSFWHAASAHLNHPDDLYILAKAARARHRLQWSQHLYYRAIAAGRTDILMVLARLRDSAGDREGAETLYRQAADAGHAVALSELAYLRREAGDREGAEALAWQAADAGDPGALTVLARLREEAGDLTGAEALTHQALEAGYTLALGSAVRLRKLMGDWEGAEALARQAADAGDPGALTVLARLREEEGDRQGAEALAQQALANGHAGTMSILVRMRKGAGDREGAEALVQQAADAGHAVALMDLVLLREEAGDREGAEALAQQAADAGHAVALNMLALLREEAGDREGAEALAQQAAGAGHLLATAIQARLREKAGDREGAEALAQQAADAGHTGTLADLASRLWPYGLDPDGTPTSPWQ
jgi:hypothetical protein